MIGFIVGMALFEWMTVVNGDLEGWLWFNLPGTALYLISLVLKKGG